VKELVYKIKPWSHQLAAIEACRERDEFALFFEMGTGKTLTAVNVMRGKFAKHGEVLPTLILCPLIVVESWQREIEANAGRAVFAATQVLTGSAKNRLKQLATPGKKIFVTNIDVVNTKLWTVLAARAWSMLIVDESHRFKSPSADRTKKLLAFADRVQYKLILTGSPILQSGMDIWAQLRILRRDIFPENFYAFRNQFFFDANSGMPTHKYFPQWKPREDAYSQLQATIAAHSMRVKKTEVLDLPPLVKMNVFVEMSAEQAKHYREMEDAFITYLGTEACVAELALTKLLRLQQLAVGILKTEDGVVRRIPTAKLDALKELLSDLCPQSKVIVWTNFIDTYEDVRAVCRELKLKSVEIVGGMKSDERQQSIDDFNRVDDVSVCIANQAAGGVGIGLQAASYMIYYSKTFSLEQDIQSESRNHRGGSEVHEKITRLDIVIKNSVDEEINSALRTKSALSEFLLKLRRRADVRQLESCAVADALQIFNN
jgi:SWI/SNF-related matrix-associated actin-dependent regulator 1 of chromatin subfamily A